MMKNLIVQLCDDSASFCHYEPSNQSTLIPYEALDAGLLWAVKNNLTIHLLFPNRELPKSYFELLSRYEYSKIYFGNTYNNGTSVYSNWSEIDLVENYGDNVIIRTSIKDFFIKTSVLQALLNRCDRVNITFTDIEQFSDELIVSYRDTLRIISDFVKEQIYHGKLVQLNLLTDRILLDKMNNCNAGYESISLCPDGKFYICPGFYLNGMDNVGSPGGELKIPNSNLYELKYAPICRECDAYHCHRCVLLNKRLTREVNTPSRQQCLMAHIERNVAADLLADIRKWIDYVPEINIPHIGYLDPLEKILNRK